MQQDSLKEQLRFRDKLQEELERLKISKERMKSEIENKEKKKLKYENKDVNTDPEGLIDILDEVNGALGSRIENHNKHLEIDIRNVDEGIKRALHEEIISFEKHIDEKNKKNNENYNHLIEIIRKTIDEAIPNSRVNIL